MKQFFLKHKFTLPILGGFVVLFFAISVVNLILGVGPNLIMKWLHASDNINAFVAKSISYGLRLLAYIVLPAYALRKVLRVNPWPGFFPHIRSAWKDILAGIGVILVVLTILFVMEARSGGLVLDGWKWQNTPAVEWLRIFWVGFLVNVCVAVGEETLFRGYLLTGLATVWGKWKALLGMSVIFGLMHLLAYSKNMSSTTLALATLLAILFGVLFGIVRLKTGSLWMPVIMHFTWNFLEADVFNLTADPSNGNLIGAMTSLQSPLTMNAITLGNVVILELLAFALIALVLLPWLLKKSTYW